MNFEWRVVTIGLSAFALAGFTTALVVPFLARRLANAPPGVRARQLAVLRLLPASAALGIALAVTLSFLLFEPRDPGESLGWVIPAFAASGLLVIGAAIGRVVQVLRATANATASWRASAEPIQLDGISVPAVAVTSAFPIVAVFGVFKPRLVIARSVLASCTSDELQAILAHEQGHIDRRDNLRRLLLAAAPDVLAWLPASSSLLGAWREATEEAADDDAARLGEDGRLMLASALVKVARLAQGPPPQALLPASAVYCGESLDARVRRLLEPRASAGAEDGRSRVTLLAVATVCALAAALQGLYVLVETTVQVLP